MKKYLIYLIILLMMNNLAISQNINRYCAVPPFLQEGSFSNLFLALDYSGSMMDFTYHKNDVDNTELLNEYNKNKTYYGFFKPDLDYYENCNEDKNICTYSIKSENNGKAYSGNFLNFKYMTRIDVIRWILTGGIVKGEYLILPKLSYMLEDEEIIVRPELRIELPNVSTYDEKKHTVKGLLQEVEKYEKKPRIGLVIFGGGYVESGEDYSKGSERLIGSPIVKTWLYPTYNYKEIIKKINEISPSGGTPTGEILDDIKHYFSREDLIWVDKEILDKKVDPYKFEINGKGKKVTVSCAKNFVVLITDGAWNGHRYFNSDDISCDKNSKKIYLPPDTTAKYSCGIDPSQPAYEMWEGGNADLIDNLPGNQNVKVFTVAAFLYTGYGQNAVKNIAIYGGFKDLDDNGIPCFYNNIPTPSPTCYSENPICIDNDRTQCSTCGSFIDLPEESCSEWDNNKDGLPDTFKQGNNPQELKKAITNIFENILKSLASSTSISAFSERTKEGTIAVQSVFYPEKRVGDKNLSWIGYLYSYWFYNSKIVQNLREDTNENKILDLTEDNIIEFNIDKNGNLEIFTYASDPSGRKDFYLETYQSLDEIHPVWEAGKKLSERRYDDRRIFTNIDGILEDIDNFEKFSRYFGNPKTFPQCLGNTDEEKLESLVEYVKGKEIKGCRNRNISSSKVWKLGDIIYSSPKIVKYKKKGYSVVFTGANDGMLHAFRAGYISKNNLGEDQVAKLQNSETDTGTDKLGEELWAFIPKNALPYLRYLPDPNYCHLYFVDLTPYIVEEKGKKILIGGMRLGGACGCSSTNCVKPPSDTCPLDSGECVGLSSYFALDITDPENPQFLWEFTDEDLGFSFSGPGIIKKRDKTYVMFVSGPTNYKGDSDQNLTIFILDLLYGNLVRKVSTFSSDFFLLESKAFIKNAFGGRLFSRGLDFDSDKNTDYIAFGYTRKDNSNWIGGIVLADVREDSPKNWKFSQILDGINPVTAKIEFMKCYDGWYMYFGTGRWFFKTDEASVSESNKLYGIRLDCSYYGCNPILRFATSSQELCKDNTLKKSWYISLNTGDRGYFDERNITDPTVTNKDIIIFTTMEPTGDICGYGGRTRVWALNCATGGSLAEDCAQYPPKKVKGTILTQLSHGNIMETYLKNFYKNKEKKLRSSPFGIGSSGDKGSEFVSSEVIKKYGEFLLWLEK